MSWRPILTGAQLTSGESNTGRFGRLFVGSSPLGGNLNYTDLFVMRINKP